MDDRERAARFEEAIAPHLSAAYNLARWLTRHDDDAADVAQDAALRAFRFLENCRGQNTRAWLLTIVRNCFYTMRQQDRLHARAVPLGDEVEEIACARSGPAEALIRQADREMLHRALQELPDEFREVLVLRELEELSYKEIAAIADLPLGTVMSRLARARARLQEILLAPAPIAAPTGTNEVQSTEKLRAT